MLYVYAKQRWIPQGSADAMGGGAGGSVLPVTAACASSFWFTQNTVFGTSFNDKTLDNDGKMNNSFKHNFF